MVSIHDVWKKFDSFEVLKGLSLDIYEGETVVILGRSGVGKSVLLKQIIGLEKPDRGYVYINGIDVTNLPPRDRYKTGLRMGMLFQGSALFDSLNVGENVAFYLRQHETLLSEKKIREKVEKALQMVGLEGTEKKMPAELSGGMRKRAALARLIVYEPSIILYDEPTTGLDPTTAMQINFLINETKRELRSTSIVVTHDTRSALEIADRIAFQEEGKILQIAPKQEFFTLKDPPIVAFFQNATIGSI